MSRKELLEFETIAIKGNTGYASAFDRNGLYKVNLSTGECQFVCFFDEPLMSKRLHAASIWIRSKVFFIPGSGDGIAIYDTEEMSLRTVSIPKASREDHVFYNFKYKFIDVIGKGNCLWLIPSTYPGLIKYNIVNDEIEVFDSWIPGYGYFIRAKALVEGNSILIASGSNNFVLKFNMNSETAQAYTIGDHNNGASCIKKIGADYFFAPRMNGSIVAWNPSLNKAKEYAEYPGSFYTGDNVFSNIYFHDGKIYFDPMMAKNGVYLQDEKLYADRTQWSINDKDFLLLAFETSTHFYYQEHGPNTEKKIFRMSKRDRSITEMEFSIVNPDSEKKEVIKQVGPKRDILFDNGPFGLEYFLDAFVDS